MRNKVKPSHTPGPWIAGELSGAIISKNHILIGYTELPSKLLSETNRSSRAKYLRREANARLIAAAPELLEACEEAWSELYQYCGANEEGGPMAEGRRYVMELLDKAICKARGT